MFSHRTNWAVAQNKYTQALQELRGFRRELLDLVISNPTECGLTYDATAILGAFQNPNSLIYQPESKGLLAAREEVSRYYREDHRETVDPNSLLLTTSTSEAYSYVFRLLCNPGDEVLVPKPSYPLFDFLADLQDVKLVPYSLQYAHGWFIDFGSVRHALTAKTRAILLVHPNNPTGSYVKSEEVPQLNALCGQHNLALIVDEVFLDYAFPDVSRNSFVANRDALTFTLSGLSKIAALPQMKVAWLAVSGPELLTRTALARLEIIADTYLSVSSPTQWAFPALFAQRHSLQPQLFARISQNLLSLKNMFTGDGACEVLEVEGGWYAVLRTSSDTSDEDRAIRLMRDFAVLVHPGHFYDFPGDGYLVVSLIVPPEAFRNGIEALREPLLQRRT